MAAFLRMLGRPSIHRGLEELEPPAGKTSSLLFYLAYRRGWVTRDAVMALLYPETDEPHARQNLRTLLAKLRRLPGAEELEIEPGRLRWPVSTDVGAFEEALAERRLPLALELYRGPLLEGFGPAPSEAFEEWLELERRELERRWHEAAVELATALDAQGRHRDAAAVLARALAADPLDEAALRLQLRALARAGDRTAALAAFAAFAERLADELGVEPEDATLRLAERLREGGGDERADAPVASSSEGHSGEHRAEGSGDVPPRASGSPRRHRPLPPRPFLGRQAELTTALAHLQDPNCRLLSFVGAGGMGKTALALELAWRLDPDDLGDVTFVPLETATSLDAAVAMVGDAIGLTFFGPASPRTQLLSALASRRDVLLLDNLEHLSGMAELVAELLREAVGLTLVTTSRERLGLRDEWVVEVHGLPVEGEAGRAAALLFDAAARRAHAGFDLAREAAAVAAICRLVGGMPLALELAAGWLPALDAAAIAASLSEGMALLRAEAPDRPARHGDVRGLLDATWRRLGDAERTALAGLAVCVGGFSVEAARSVADVDPPLLRRLATRALVRRQEDGRFVQHPLLWRYARERAAADADAREAARARHAAYFAGVLERVAATTHGGRNRPRAEDVAELPNVLEAWAWAAERGRTDLLAQGVDGLLTLARASQRPQEVAQAVARAVDAAAPESAVQARLLRALGELQLWSYEGRAAADALQRSAALAERQGDRREVGLALFFLALSAAFDDAPSVDVPATWKRCVATFREVGDAYHEGRSLVNLADGVADPLERERLLRTAVGLLRTDDGTFGLTLALHNLARTLQLAHGAYAAARPLLDEASEVERAVGMPFRLAWWQAARVELCLDEGRLDGLEAQLAEAERVAATVGPGMGSWVVDYVALVRGRVHLARGELERGDLARAMDVLGRVRYGESGRPDPYGHRAEAACWFALAALRAGRSEEAEQAAQDALAAAPTNLGTALYEWWSRGAVAAGVLIEVRAERGAVAAAVDVLRSTLEVVRTLRLLPSALHLCLGAARLPGARGDAAAERSLLALAAHHPAAAAHTRQAARRRLAGAAPSPASGAQDAPLALVLDAIERAQTGAT